MKLYDALRSSCLMEAVYVLHAHTPGVHLLGSAEVAKVCTNLRTVAGLTCVMRVNFLPSSLHLFSKAARAKCALFGLLLDTTCHTHAVVQGRLLPKQNLCHDSHDTSRRQ